MSKQDIIEAFYQTSDMHVKLSCMIYLKLKDNLQNNQLIEQINEPQFKEVQLNNYKYKLKSKFFA